MMTKALVYYPPPRPLPFIKKSRDELQMQAWEILGKIKTPVYDELVRPLNSKVWEEGWQFRGIVPGARERFDEYVRILKETYPECKPEVVVTGSQGEFQPWQASQGNQNYFTRFNNVERACQFARQYNFPVAVPQPSSKFYSGPPTKPIYDFNLAELLTDMKLRNEQEVAALKANANIAKFNGSNRTTVYGRTGNLLELNRKPNEPNLLSFKPTKIGINARSKELETLFGGRSKSKKQRRKNRKTRRR